MNPSDFIDVAKYLVVKNKAAFFRSAISRSYYGVFNAAKNYFNSIGVKVSKKAGCHKEIESYLNNSGDTELTKIGVKVGDLSSSRARADYHLDDSGKNTEKFETAKNAIEQSEIIILIIDRIKQEPNKGSKVKDNVNRWKEISKDYPI